MSDVWIDPELSSRIEFAYRAGNAIEMSLCLKMAKAELDRLRAENERLRNEKYEFREQYDYKKVELDRLRTEKAEMAEALKDLLNLKQGCHERADALLAKANETEGK